MHGQSGELVVLNDDLHYFGGLLIDRQTDSDIHYVLDLNNPTAWQVRSTFLYPRNHFQGVALDGKIFASGGQFGHDGGLTETSLLTVYNSTTNIWNELAPLPAPRSHTEAGTLVINERLFMLGGRNQAPTSYTVYNDIIEYNPQIDSWQTVGAMPRVWYFPYVAFIDNKLIATAGGTNWNNLLTETWIADITLDCSLNGS